MHDQPATTTTADEFGTRYDKLPKFGRFEVRKLLGEGGFAKVFLAHDSTLDRLVAIKVPHTHSDQVDFMRREGRMAAKLRHPAIVQIYEICSDSAVPSQSNGSPVYLVMQYIEGTSLARKLETEKPTRDNAVDLLLAIAEAVSYAHGAGVLHRDLKPQNILLDINGRPYVTDFGLAVRQETLAHHVGEGYGTPAYMSPEQANGKTLTPTSDIWSLGVMLYEMLVQQRPFGSHPAEVFSRLAKEDPVRPTALDSTVPQDLEAICLKCMARNPTERYASVQDLITDLRQWKTHRSVGPNEDDLERAERYYKQALASMEAGDLAVAVERLRNVVQLNPDFANGYYRLGLCYLMADQPLRLALAALKRATELNRDNDAANYVLANVYYELNAFNLAAVHADQALAIKPTDQAYRNYQRKARQKASTTLANDSVKTAELNYDIDGPRRRLLTEVADAVFHLEKTRKLTLRHWVTLHQPWRALTAQPFGRSLVLALSLYVLCLTLHLVAGDNLRALQFAVVYVLIWFGLYFPYLVGRMLERTYVRLLPVINMPEDAFRRFFVRQAALVLGGTCTLNDTQGDVAAVSWQHNRGHILIALTALAPLLVLQYVCAHEPPWPMTLPKLALYFSGFLEVYVLAWIFPLALSCIFFIPRFSSIPLRYFLGMPQALSLGSVGTFYIRMSWLGCCGYLFFMVQHYVFRTYENAPMVTIAYIVIGNLWMFAVVVISQYQLYRLLTCLRARKIFEYSYHLEDSFERVMKNPTDKAFEQLRAHQQFMSSLQRLNTCGLTRADIVHFLLITAVIFAITLAYAYLVLNQV
jgi:tetratricopeptide (TPR) repeat protein